MASRLRASYGVALGFGPGPLFAGAEGEHATGVFLDAARGESGGGLLSNRCRQMI